MAPENWRAQGAYTQKVDIYSFAIIAWEVLSQIPAYDDLVVKIETLGEWVAERGCRPFIPLNWPPALSKLIQNSWASDPARRPTVREVIDALELFQRQAKVDPRLYESLAVPARTAETVLTAFNQRVKTESWPKSFGARLGKSLGGGS
jgi:serine/threonine protein kinase